MEFFMRVNIFEKSVYMAYISISQPKYGDKTINSNYIL